MDLDSFSRTMFDDIVEFHEKFELVPMVVDGKHAMTTDQVGFRVAFMLEELQEYVRAALSESFDAEKALDSLVDLVYVALGTAYLHDFQNFDEAWRRVHAANMAKVRAVDEDDHRSVRKHKTDVVKPAGWKPPVLADLLK